MYTNFDISLCFNVDLTINFLNQGNWSDVIGFDLAETLPDLL
jgi:hypothetical protein